ncbi:TonB-dependent receptor [Erythrobacter sp. KY5]|uniref:TonB-dependent receptor n=1 Tax=Erythrobacter sp. KY5 TaxID=2011159 RepID=UPI0013A70B5E|nr:TonB-dependent receptor [Erythrobacter sp. KY5]
MQANLCRTAVAALLTSASFLAAPAAFAQSQPTVGEQDEQAEEESGVIVVTARRTSETLIEAPVAVSAFSAEQILDAGIERPSDFAQLVPNLLLVDTAEAGDTQVIIRGIINARDVDPSYALVVDGVLQPDTFALNRDLVGIEQIEVVKGPVSSLYGRNAVGGAILITTKRPSDTFEGNFTAEYGNGDHVRLAGIVSGPVTDGLYFSVASSYTDRDGVIDNELGGTMDYYEEARVRGRLLWEFTPDASLDLIGEYADIDGSSIIFQYQSPLQPQFAIGIDVNDTSLPYAPNVDSINFAERLDLTAKLDWDFGPVELFAAVGYNENENKLGSDFLIRLSGATPTGVIFEGLNDDFSVNNPFGILGYTPFPGTIAYQQRDGEALTAEARLSGEFFDGLSWTTGIYAADIERTTLVSVQLDPGDGSIQLQNPGPQTLNVSEFQTTETDVFSVYAQLIYDIIPELEIAFSGRFDREERVATNLLDPAFAPVPTINVPVGFAREAEFDRFQPRFSLRWAPTDSFSLYGSYGEAFRAGGFNQAGTRDTVLAIDFAGVDPAAINIFDDYQEEVVKGWEAGFKSRFAGGTVQLNGAVFLTDTTNSQSFEFTPITSSRTRVNIDETQIKGFEIDALWQATDALTFTAAYGYVKATVEEYTPNPAAVGNRLPSVPKSTLNLGAQLDVPLSDRMNLVGRADYQRIGETPWDINGAAGTVRDPVNLLGARLGVEINDFTVTAWVTNLLDEEYYQENIILYSEAPSPTTPVSAIANTMSPGEPRRFGIQLSYDF